MTATIPKPPPGFVLDQPSPTGVAPDPPPPPGFVLDTPPPPPGFVLDQPTDAPIATALPATPPQVAPAEPDRPEFDPWMSAKALAVSVPDTIAAVNRGADVYMPEMPEPQLPRNLVDESGQRVWPTQPKVGGIDPQLPRAGSDLAGSGPMRLLTAGPIGYAEAKMDRRWEAWQEHGAADFEARTQRARRINAARHGATDWLVTGLRALPPEDLRAEVQRAAQGPLFEFNAASANAWAATVGQQIPILAANYGASAAGAAAGTLAAGPVGGKVGWHAGGIAAMSLMEAGTFYEAADRIGLDRSLSRQYARYYGIGSGLIEHAQNMWMGGGMAKPATKAARGALLKRLFKFLAGAAWEGGEEFTQNALETWLLGKAVADHNAMNPGANLKAPALGEGGLRAFVLGAGVGGIMRAGGTGIRTGVDAVRGKADASAPVLEPAAPPGVQTPAAITEPAAIQGPTEDATIQGPTETAATPVEAVAIPAEQPTPQPAPAQEVAPAAEAEMEADRMEAEEGVFQADPTEATAYDRKAGGFVTVPGGKQGPSKPWLTLDKTQSPDEGIADFFGRTKRLGSPMNKLRQAGARVKAGLRKRFLFLSELPHGEQFAYARDAIRTMPEQQRSMMEKAVEDVQGYLEGEGTRQVLDTPGLDLLRQKVFTEDIILEGERAVEEASHALAENPNLTDAEFNRITSRRFPEGTTRKSWEAQKERVDELMEQVPSVRDAYQKRQDLWKKVSADLADRGVISQEAAKNVHYVRHFVLDYMDTQRKGAVRPRKLKEPYRGYAKERKGTRRDISTDLLELELKALSDIYRDNAVQDLAEGLAAHYDRRGDMPEGANVQAWTANEGLVEWHFKRPNLMFVAQTVSDAKIAQLAQEGAELIAGEVSIPVSAMHKALVIGGKRKMFLIPGEVAAQLDDLPVTHQAGKLASFTAPITRFWKRWILRVNPIRYNKRNAIGDAERVNAAGKTHAFVRVPAAVKMLVAHRAPAEHAEAYSKGLEYGAFGSSLWHEMGDARSRPEFERYQDVRDLAGWKRAMNRAAWPAKLVSRGGQWIQDRTQGREDVLRAAVYLDALDQVDAYLKDGTPIRHWVGMQEEIHALAKIDKYRAAAKIARETLGDYGAFTPWENDRLRNELMPFYSWLKINTTFWPKVLKESAKEGAGKKTKGAAIAAGAWGVAKWTARITAAYAALTAWNNSDEEKRKKEAALPWWIRTRPHINTDGGVIYEPSALSDFVEWFDLEQIAPDLQRWERGQISTKELIAAVAATEAKAPINRIFQTLNPFLKTPLTLTGTKTFPDVFDSYHYARSFSSKTAAEAFLDVLGTDTRKFVDVAKGKRTLREVLTYYFTGSAYRPMTLADLEKQIQEHLEKATLKRKSRTTGRGPGEPKAGRERDVDILINRGGTPVAGRSRGSRTQRPSR